MPQSLREDHNLSKKQRDLLLVRIHKEDLGPEKYSCTCVPPNPSLQGEAS